jgi:hypothetical protein
MAVGHGQRWPVVTLPLFNFTADWGAASLKITREFKTDIIVSRSGREQRRALRDTPRKSVEFTSTLSGATLRAFYRTMEKSGGQTGVLPDFSRSLDITAPASAGGFTVDVGSIPDWIADGLNVVLMTLDGVTAETLVISTTSTTSLTFMSALVNAWSAPAVVRPGLTGRLAVDTSASQITDGVNQVSVHFDVSPGSERGISDGAAALIYDSREVFLLQPNWASAVTPSYHSPFEVLDYGFGVVGYYNPITFNTRIKQAVYLARSPVEALFMEQFHQRMRGQRGEFYAPTWENDLPLKVPAVALAASIRVDGRDTHDAYTGDTVYGAIAIILNDGSLITRQVVSLTLVSDGIGTNDTLVNLDAELGVDITAANVSAISWMPVCRLASDTLTTEWLTDGVAQFQLNQQTVENLPPE